MSKKDLTARKQKLFHAVRHSKKAVKAWSIDGRIFAGLTNTSRSIFLALPVSEEATLQQEERNSKLLMSSQTDSLKSIKKEAEDEPALLNVTFDIPQPMVEESLPNLEAHVDMERGNIVRYQLENSGSQRGKPILVDSMGFSYVKRKECRGKVYRRCFVRGRSLTCKATVIQRGEEMARGCLQHCHEGRPGLLKAAVQVREEVRTTALTHVYRPAAAIMEEVVVRTTG